MTEERFTVEHRPEEARYALLDNAAEGGAAAVIGEESYVDAPAAEGPEHRVLFHTGVSDDYAGQGLASILVRAAVEDAIAGGRRVVPVCPYVAKWLTKHPEYAEHVVEPQPAHLRAVSERRRSR